MGFLDNVKKAATAAREQASNLADKHGDKIDQAIEKGGSMVDQRTHGKYSDKIAKAQGAARNAADKVAGESSQSGTSGATGTSGGTATSGATGTSGASGPRHTPPPPPPPPPSSSAGEGSSPTASGDGPPMSSGAGPTAGAGPTPPPPPPPTASGDESPMSAPVAPVELPSPVREFIEAVNAHDEQAFLDSFGASGVVDDWGREFAGRAAIKEWSDKEFIGARGTMEVQRVDAREGHVIVVADWRSNHANGLSEFTFDTTDDTVDRMTIRGAH